MRDFLYEHAAAKPVSFHMPGHKGSELYRRFGYGRFLDDFLDLDITEIPGADDLFVADGIIGEVQKRYAALYGVKKSYLMVNGTSGALIASILACVSQRNGNCEGGEGAERSKMIVGSNSHRAVLNGLALAGAEPVFVEPVSLWGGDVEGPVASEQVQRAVEKNPDAAAVLITSPNYYGILSDIEEIARIVHEAGMILIVDQAHGAHLAFFEEYFGAPAPAEKLGADIVTCSIHKTMASMTQSAVLHICSDRIDTELIEEKLRMIESSSPSYILMTSLDINASIVEEHGEELFGEWKAGLDMFYERAEKIRQLQSGGTRMRTLAGYIDENCRDMIVDRSKIVVDMGMPAEKLERLLMEKGIFCEKKNGNALVCLSGIGNTMSDYETLAGALEEIAMG